MQNVKICIWKDVKYFVSFPSKSYVFEHSESIDMHIEQSLKKKTYIIFFRCPQRIGFCRIVIKLRRSLLGFFFTALIREDTHKKSVFFSGRTTKRGEGGNPPDH